MDSYKVADSQDTSNSRHPSKLRSIRLSRFPSLRSRIRPMNSPSTQCPTLLSGYAASSDASKGSFQKSSTNLSRRSTFKPMKSLTRVSSMKFRKPLLRKSSGRTDLNKTRPIKPANIRTSTLSLREDNAEYHQPSIVLSSQEDTSPKFSEAHFQVSPHYSESSFSSNDQNSSNSKIAKPKSDYSARVLKRTSTLRPQRILTKTASLKSKRPPKKCSEVSQLSDSIVDRATCSSTLKDSKFSHRIEHQTGGTSAMKVCRYAYCSLHGHRHGTLPPIKRFVSMRRRLLKAQKSTKPDSRSVPKAKRSSQKRKGTPTSQLVYSGDFADQKAAQGSGENSFVTDKILQIMHSSLVELKDSLQNDNLSPKLDDIVSTSNVVAPVHATVNQEINADTVANLNLEISKCDSESEEVLDVSTTPKVIGEEKNEDSEPENGFQEGFLQSGDLTANCTPDRCHKTQIKEQKFAGFWGLIYHHMVSGIAAEFETQLPHNGKSKEKQDEEDHTLLHNNIPVSHQSSSGTDQGMGIRDCDANDQKFEPWQSDAIKLVQEAFDKILSEIPDQSSDDQSISSEVTSEEELLERKESEDAEDTISCSFGGTNKSVVQGPEETQLKVVNINTSEEGKVASQLGAKSNWSNLKKVIILKRFVKALEKVRNFNPRKLQCLPVEPDPDTEKVHLRHQTMEERKKAEEWMLDHALRQVISKLAPAEKRKVALLVQAFETVSPLPEIGTHPKLNAAASAHATPVSATGEQNNGLPSKASYPHTGMSLKGTLDQVSDFHIAGQLIPGTCSELKERSLRCCSNAAAGKPASEAALTNLEEEKTVAFNFDKRDNNSMLKEYQPDFIDSYPKKLEEPTLSHKASSKLDDTVGTSHGELVNGEILSEIYKHNIKFNNEKLETVNAAGEQACQPKISSPENYAESNAVSSTITSASFSEMLEAPVTACREDADPKYEVLQESSRLEEPEPNDTVDISQEAKIGKQKYTRLWYLIYKHMVSSTAEGGTQSLPDGVDCKDQGSEANTLFGMKDADSCKDSSEMNQEIIIDNQNESCQRIECHQIEAIKLIEEAIDEIQLPDIQEESQDDHSFTGNMNLEMKIQKKHGEDGELLISTTSDSTEHTFRESNNTKLDHLTTLDPRETWLNSNDIAAPAESETVSKLGNKSKPQMQKSWCNLKKLILLKRFIKGLEKVRKLNPVEPRHLPFVPDSEAEKVHLRRQSTEDRKNAEEWMLDYALQQVVAKLTPARKRKVELLIEAFETVTPTLEVKNH